MTTVTMSDSLPGVAPPAHQPAGAAFTWAARQLQRADAEPLRAGAAWGALGLALAASYGVAMGLGGGVSGMWQHACAVLWMLGTVVLMATPALYILLSLCDAPLSAENLVAETSHALFRVGLLLAGMAPALALYATTASAGVSGLMGLGGMYFAGAVGLSALTGNVLSGLEGKPRVVSWPSTLALAAFALFAMALVARISFGLLSGGAP